MLGIFARMDAVTTHAAHIRLSMAGALKVCMLSGMASQAGFVHFLRRRLGGIEQLHLAAAIHMRLARAVTALAGCAVLAMGQRELGVGILGKTFSFRVVTGRTSFR